MAVFESVSISDEVSAELISYRDIVELMLIQDESDYIVEYQSVNVTLKETIYPVANEKEHPQTRLKY